MNNCDGSKLLFRSKASKEISTKKKEKKKEIIVIRQIYSNGSFPEVGEKQKA